MNKAWLAAMQAIDPDIGLKLAEVHNRVQYERSEYTVLPDPGLVFEAFKNLDPDEVRVLILGQDPYPTKGKPVGRAFALPKNWPKINSSIANIRDVVERTQGGKLDLTLDHWQKQGVLLLNTRLTVRENAPMSHAGIGWEPVIACVLRTLNALPQPPIAMLWGNEAQKFEKLLPRAVVLKTSHPCKFSAHRGFMQMNHFTTANATLELAGKSKIYWTEPG